MPVWAIKLQREVSESIVVRTSAETGAEAISHVLNRVTSGLWSGWQRLENTERRPFVVECDEERKPDAKDQEA